MLSPLLIIYNFIMSFFNFFNFTFGYLSHHIMYYFSPIFSDRKKAIKIAHVEKSKNIKMQKILTNNEHQSTLQHQMEYQEELKPLNDQDYNHHQLHNSDSMLHNGNQDFHDSRYVISETTTPVHNYRHYGN